jgi:hypothetical protein
MPGWCANSGEVLEEDGNERIKEDVRLSGPAAGAAFGITPPTSVQRW